MVKLFILYFYVNFTYTGEGELIQLHNKINNQSLVGEVAMALNNIEVISLIQLFQML